MSMIMIKTEDRRFSMRAAALMLHEQHVLLQLAAGSGDGAVGDDDDFWFVPGGRIELLEPAHTTLAREMHEELGVEVCIERLLWIVENFFVHRGRAGHEIGFYFLATLPPPDVVPHLYARGETIVTHDEQGIEQVYRWVALDALNDIAFYPTFLRHRLRALPMQTEHLVHIDEESAAALAPLMSRV